MLRQSLLITALCAGSVTLTGCSTFETAMNSTAYMFSDIYNGTKSVFLRGSPEATDVKFAETAMPAQDGTISSQAGVYVPASAPAMAETVAPFTSDYPSCPEGSYLSADNSCMFADTAAETTIEIEFFDDYAYSDMPVETGQVPCPEGTYLNADNNCMSLEVDNFEFTDDVNMVEQYIDTSPVPCPEGTYLNAENSCMYLEIEDFAAELESDGFAQNDRTFGVAQNSSTDLTASP